MVPGVGSGYPAPLLARTAELTWPRPPSRFKPRMASDEVAGGGKGEGRQRQRPERETETETEMETKTETETEAETETRQ